MIHKSYLFCRNLETVARSGLDLARDLARIKHGEAQNLLNRSVVSLVMEDCSLELVW